MLQSRAQNFIGNVEVMQSESLTLLETVFVSLWLPQNT